MVGVEIRGTHPYSFRSGQWATVIGLEWANDRACYRVRFWDGKEDSWPVQDPWEPYEFRSVNPHEPQSLRYASVQAERAWQLADELNKDQFPC